MKRLALAVVPVLVGSLLGPGLVFADSPSGAGQGRAVHAQRFQQRLGLTDQQAQAIKAIWQRQHAAGRQVWQALGKARQDLRQLALSGADDTAIRAKTTEIEGLQAQALQLRVAGLREMAPLLTDEQKQKMMQTPEHPRRFRKAPAA